MKYHNLSFANIIIIIQITKGIYFNLANNP